MATRWKSEKHRAEERGIKYVSRQEGNAILNRQAKKYLNMSGDEFVRDYRAGRIPDPDRSEVHRVAILIPLADK